MAQLHRVLGQGGGQGGVQRGLAGLALALLLGQIGVDKEAEQATGLAAGRVLRRREPGRRQRAAQRIAGQATHIGMLEGLQMELLAQGQIGAQRGDGAALRVLGHAHRQPGPVARPAALGAQGGEHTHLVHALRREGSRALYPVQGREDAAELGQQALHGCSSSRKAITSLNTTSWMSWPIRQSWWPWPCTILWR